MTSRASGAYAQDWYARDVLDVARDLLGALLTTSDGESRVTVRLTEVEAYRGAEDPGSHAFRGRTARNEVMFGAPGRLYVYRHLGLHTCANVVCGPPGLPCAVLLRAGEVVEGVELARLRRTRGGVVRSDVEIARGPARLTVALGIELGWNGRSVTDPGGAVVVHRGDAAGGQSGDAAGVNGGGATIVAGPRVGVGGPGGEGDRFPWRFWLAGEPTVSAYRRAVRRPTAPRPGRPTH